MPTYARIDDGIVAEAVHAAGRGRCHTDRRVVPSPTCDGSTYRRSARSRSLAGPITARSSRLRRFRLRLPCNSRRWLCSAQPVTVTCSALPALDGAYPIDQATQMQITGIAAAISAGLGLPGGGATLNWPDVGGVAHPWPAPQFTEFAKAVMNYVYACAQSRKATAPRCRRCPSSLTERWMFVSRVVVVPADGADADLRFPLAGADDQSSTRSTSPRGWRRSTASPMPRCCRMPCSRSGRWSSPLAV